LPSLFDRLLTTHGGHCVHDDETENLTAMQFDSVKGLCVFCWLAANFLTAKAVESLAAIPGQRQAIDTSEHIVHPEAHPGLFAFVFVFALWPVIAGSVPVAGRSGRECPGNNREFR